MSENMLPKIAITHGDMNGIAYEVIMKALIDNKMLELCTPIVYGLAKTMLFYRKQLPLSSFSFQTIKNCEQATLKKVNLINITEKEVQVETGVSSSIAGNMAEMALDMACKDIKRKQIHAIVTAPINKSNISSNTFCFQGHTEYFAHQFSSPKAMMLMISDFLKIGFVTHHLPISEVAKHITEEIIVDKLQILHQSLATDFCVTNPKIAVLSLNPHVGDQGRIGEEDDRILKPAILRASDQQINAFGPFAADGFFASEEYKKFDAVLAMYHDQGMLPFKILSRNEGVNFTAGLPIVRTSPAHGTAYDIAGKNIANEQSMRNAIYWAIDILKNRNSFY